MAVMDYQLELADDQDIAASTLSSGASVVSTHVIDLGGSEADAFAGALTPDIGEGGELELNLRVTNEAFAGAGATVSVALVTKASSATIASSGTTLATVVLPATSAVGTKRSIGIPAGTVERYLGIVCTAVGGNLTAGNLSAWIGFDHEKHD